MTALLAFDHGPHQRGEDGGLAAEGEASVYQDNLSGHMAGIVRTEEDDDSSHVFRLGYPPEDRALFGPFQNFGGGVWSALRCG